MQLEPQGPISAGPGRTEGTSTDQKGTTGTKPNPNPDLETSQKSPEGETGRADQTGKGTSKGKQAPETPAEEDVFDLSKVPEELRPHVEAAVRQTEKQLKANYTKKTQELAKQRHKVEAYDSFESNPVDTMRRMAEQYGFQLTPKGGQAKGEGDQNSNQPFSDDWQPKSWREVFDAFSGQFRSTVMGDLKPVFDNIQTLTTKNIEKQLEEIDSDWKLYEDDMVSNLKVHPTLAKDVSKLYRMSVPDEVLESRATQKALKKFEEKGHSAKIGSKSSVQSSQASGNKINSFNDAVVEAKRKIAAGEV